MQSDVTSHMTRPENAHLYSTAVSEFDNGDIKLSASFRLMSSVERLKLLLVKQICAILDNELVTRDS